MDRVRRCGYVSTVINDYLDLPIQKGSAPNEVVDSNDLFKTCDVCRGQVNEGGQWKTRVETVRFWFIFYNRR